MRPAEQSSRYGAGAAGSDAAPVAHHPKADTSTCLSNLASVHAPRRFDDFPVKAEPVEHWKAPLPTTTEATHFRTMLLEAATAPPNFAGHYTIAVWGCGTSCTDFAIIDRRTGQVFVDETLRAISAVHIAPEPAGPAPIFAALRLRPDSRLLVLLGAPHEDPTREGIHFLKWTGDKLLQLRFVPQHQAGTPTP